MSYADDAGFARTPKPPYFAVLFTARRTSADPAGYAATADAMVALASRQPGYLGIESVRDETGLGITISYWSDESSIAGWKRVAEHVIAQRTGRERWYEHYELRVAKVERAYSNESSPCEGLEVKGRR